MPRELPIRTIRVLVVMCLHCSYGGFDAQAVAQQANGRYQPRPKADGCMPWFDSPGSPYMVFWPFVEGLAAAA